MSQKPSIIFNPDFSRLVLDPSTNQLITAGELAKRRANAGNSVQPAPPKPAIVHAVAPAAKSKPVEKPVVPSKPADKPVEKPAVAATAKPAPPVAKPVSKPVDKPVAKAVSTPDAKPKPAAKPAAVTKVDISASLNAPAPVYKGPTVIPLRGGYGAVLGRNGRR